MVTAVVMAVRRKLGYIEPTLEQNEALQGFVRVNWEVIRLCYEAGYQSSACLSARIVCAYTRNTYSACNANVTRPSSLRLRGVGFEDETI